jgi:hypothetical protein
VHVDSLAEVNYRLASAVALLGNRKGQLGPGDPPAPRLAGPWWTIAGDPDLGPLTSPKQQPVDFGLWQAADGTWQLWFCIRGTKEPGKTRLFHRWEGAKLTDRDRTQAAAQLRGPS